MINSKKRLDSYARYLSPRHNSLYPVIHDHASGNTIFDELVVEGSIPSLSKPSMRYLANLVQCGDLKDGFYS